MAECSRGAGEVTNRAIGHTEGEAGRFDGAYYHGAYGPTIILVASSVEDVKWLHDVFVGLSEEGESIDLAIAPAMRIKAVRHLILERVSSAPSVALDATSTGVPGEAAEFLWRQDAARWRRTALLLEPLIEVGTGHQYLTHEGKDAALVEVSINEADVLKPSELSS